MLLLLFLLLSNPHSPRPCRVAGPSAAILAKLLPCATSFHFVRVGPEPPRLTSVRVLLLHPHAHAAYICIVLAPALPCHSRASTHQSPLCSAAHVLPDPCARITSFRSCPRHSRTDALLPLRCAPALVRPTPASQRRLLA
jgi:hypothetical protein